MQKLEQYKKNKSKPFFLWKFYFAEVFQRENPGFDVVIANPPYVRADKPEIAEQRKKVLESKKYQTLWEKWDLYVVFIERAFQILASDGVLEFIIPDAYMTSKYAKKSHDFFLEDAIINRIDFCSNLKIFDASVKNMIIEFKKNKNDKNIPRRIKHTEFFGNEHILESGTQKEWRENIFNVYATPQKQVEFKNCLKWGEICYVSYGLRPSSDERYWKGEFKKGDLISDARDEIHPKPYIEGKFIAKWIVKKIKYLEWYTERSPRKLVRPTFPELYLPEKIMMGGMTGAIVDERGLLCNHSITVSVLWKDLQKVKNRSIEMSIRKDFQIKGDLSKKRNEIEQNSNNFSLKYLISILNSKFGNYFLHTVRRSQIGFYPDDIKKLPIKKISKDRQKPFIDSVDQILNITKDDDYLDNPDKQSKVKRLEKEIEILVYRLYELTPEEIEVVENFNKEK